MLDRNWKCPAGEAGIVARDGDEAVFVTVTVLESMELPRTPAESLALAERAFPRIV